MKNKIIQKSNVVGFILYIFGLIGIVLVLYIDKNHLSINLLEIGEPNFNINYLIRTLAIFISILMLLYGLIINKRINLRLLLDSNSKFIDKWLLYGTLTLSVFFLLLLILNPYFFSIISDEDNIIEWSSALFLFGTSITFLVTLKITYKNTSIAKYNRWLLLFFSMAFFMVAMEEVSWFQRVIGFNTPQAFEGNLQQEVNLHNFATNYSENIYYQGSFGFLVILPFIHLISPTYIKIKHLKHFIPRPLIAIIGAFSCSYNFDRWDSIITQLTFFSCIIILASFVIFSTNKKERNIILFTIVLLIIQQVIFLNSGTDYLSPYVLKEYKEFFIPIGFFAYSLNVFFSFKNHLNPSKFINTII